MALKLDMSKAYDRVEWSCLDKITEKLGLEAKLRELLMRGGPKLSHLFFDDDSLIFCKATPEDCTALQRILKVYECASGQQLNMAKTSLFFSSNTPSGVKEEIKFRFGAQVIKQHEKYLGLPSLIGRRKRSSFDDIKEKLGKKLAGWKEKLLSKAGK
ncbi:uncharacterized protein LOC142606164 [Castanea sativa]|uniref:uncharacterized protein LOC142606164 n=1 Tax=Castanea sativa TaxID=21020 RepID=UPI003F64C45B